MTRRDILKLASLSLMSGVFRDPLGLAGLRAGEKGGVRGGRPAGFPIVIKKAMAFLGNDWRTPDIGITETGRLMISESPLSGKLEIMAANKIVSPGFIDILGDNSSSPDKTYNIFEKYKVTDGVTTVLQMHGGSEKAGAYYDRFSRVPHWTNYGVSTKVMRIRQLYRDRSDRYRQVERCLDEGALGVSHSIEYQPDTSRDELAGYAGLARKYDRPLFLHLRYSSPQKELDGVEEAIQLAKATGARLHIDHLNSTGGTYHMAEALRRIREAIRSGLEITVCVYPFSYWATYLDSERFAPGWQEQFQLTYNDLEVVGSGERLTQESFDRYRRQKGILVSVPPGTMPLASTADLALQEDFCLVASDGGIEREPRANNHPRGACCFSTAIRHAFCIKMPLEKMLEKFTTMPARVLRPALDSRGILEDGAIADLTIFDPEKVEGAATVANPNQFSKGIETVIVNGSIAYHQGELRAAQGEAISLGLSRPREMR